ncbi:unnamed protein product, partial [Discosporangium mesarthrocarpum]
AFFYLLALLASVVSAAASGQPEPAQMKRVFPEADYFSAKQGEPPVYHAYRGDPDSGDAELLGYLFETPDLPPEEIGYSAPIE